MADKWYHRPLRLYVCVGCGGKKQEPLRAAIEPHGGTDIKFYYHQSCLTEGQKAAQKLMEDIESARLHRSEAGRLEAGSEIRDEARSPAHPDIPMALQEDGGDLRKPTD